jgi:hypothetical protein
VSRGGGGRGEGGSRDGGGTGSSHASVYLQPAVAAGHFRELASGNWLPGIGNWLETRIDWLKSPALRVAAPLDAVIDGSSSSLLRRNGSSPAAGLRLMCTCIRWGEWVGVRSFAVLQAWADRSPPRLLWAIVSIRMRLARARGQALCLARSRQGRYL